MSDGIKWKLAIINNSIEKLVKIVEQNEDSNRLQELKSFLGKDNKLKASSFDDIKNWFDLLKTETLKDFKKIISQVKYEESHERIRLDASLYSALESIRKEKNLNSIEDVIYNLVIFLRNSELKHGNNTFLSMTKDEVNSKGSVFPL
ncbi:hypothetical protein [Shewanella phaeophyticola]|uniref:Uncharacterized protein n=1 Tax=Shewanella phaeophyticola TaxID=2978345 RepID=A0ABT2NYK4_9GAMM|nr:hypothetical protein [Shewanella sp. KJ10-1]MCT8985282.1 hypothetical protein [Shewanella sp. KJ10-1]